jgi:hypothetical protein
MSALPAGDALWRLARCCRTVSQVTAAAQTPTRVQEDP